MVKPIPEAEYPVLMSIVNSEYTDELDRILSARQNDDGSIICVGQDGIKQVACKIDDDGIKLGEPLVDYEGLFGGAPTRRRT